MDFLKFKINNFNDSKILDSGCVNVIFCYIITKNIVIIFALYLSKEPLEIEKSLINSKLIKHLHFILFNSNHLPFDSNYFNVIFSFKVNEHIENPQM